MGEREGFFWDFIEGRAPQPPAAATLGFRLVDVDPDAGTIAVDFAAGEHLLNPAGTVQGGFLAAMLDDTMGPALIATLPAGFFAPTVASLEHSALDRSSRVSGARCDLAWSCGRDARLPCRSGSR